MSEIRFVKPTVEMVEAIAADMRQADVDEVWASNHHTPIESLMKGWDQSDYVSVAVNDKDEPLVMFGLVKRDVLSGYGIIWLLGTNNAMNHRREFLTKTPVIIDQMMTICPRLCNMVHDKNKESIRWLKWLGFTIDDPVPHGPHGELFHRFHKEKEHVNV